MGRRRPQSANLGERLIEYAFQTVVDSIFGSPPPHARLPGRAQRIAKKTKQIEEINRRKSIQVAPGVTYLPPAKQRSK